MPDKKQIVRQLDILRTLLARTYGVTYRELVVESGVDKRTIQRDLKVLKEEVGFMIDGEMRDGKKYFKLVLLTLAAERIQNLEITSQTFDPPDDLDIENRIQQAFGITLEDPMDVKIRFSAWQARYIQQRTWHPSQEIEELDNGEIILSFRAGGFYDIKSWILSHGADAEVLEPASLREEIMEELEKNLNFYKKT